MWYFPIIYCITHTYNHFYIAGIGDVIVSFKWRRVSFQTHYLIIAETYQRDDVRDRDRHRDHFQNCYIFVTPGGPGEPPEDGEMNEMTLSSRHRIRNSSPGGLRPSTLPLGHVGSHNTEFYTWMGEKHFCFFQTAETGNRTPNSSVKGSGANHYPRAPARRLSRWASRWCVDSHLIFASVVASLVTCLIALTFALVCFALKMKWIGL